MAPTAYSADMASGTYFDPPSASSTAARTRSETTWRQRATEEGVASALVLELIQHSDEIPNASSIMTAVSSASISISIRA